jgi:hypothetical protein
VIALNSPANITAEVFDTLVSGIADASRASRYGLYRGEAVRSELELLRAGASGASSRLAPDRDPQALREDMEWLYDQRLVRSVEGRAIYDSVMKLGRGECPFCGIAGASTLDHTLPKTHYPRLAVTPLNLVPACRDCNTEKLSAVSAGNISPYFDHWVSREDWLQAQVLNLDEPWILAFGVKPVATWTTDQNESVEHHFRDLKLAKRYSVQAVTEWRNYGAGLAARAAAEDGTLRTVLEERRNLTVAYRRNGWRAATYQAWIDVLDDARWDVAV